jgi:hypothetical protein
LDRDRRDSLDSRDSLIPKGTLNMVIDLIETALAARPEPELPDDERFVRLATAVMQLREFLALHRAATGRSDVNIRKVIRLLDDALLDNPDPARSTKPG